MSFWNFLGNAASGVMSLGTSLINRHSQKEANKRNAEQNELNRQFNADEAAKQRQFEAEQARLANEFSANQAQLAFQRESGFAQKMWKMENDYNSPNAQLQRLRDAGLNPNLFGGDNTAGSVGSASSSAPNGAMPHGSSASAPNSISQNPVTLTNPLLEAAQIRNLNAQTDKLGSDVDVNEANVKRLNELLNGELEIQRLQISQLDFDLNKLSPEKVNNLIAQTNNFNKESSLVDERIKEIQAVIEKYKSEKNLTDEQVKRAQIENESLPKYLEAQIASALADVGVKKQQAALLAQETTNAILTGGTIALDFQKAKLGQSDAIEIARSDAEWSKLVDHWKLKYPRLHWALEQGGWLMGGIARGLGNAAARIGSSLVTAGAAGAAPK